MRAQEARQIPISEYLEREGVTPAHAKKSGRELWYLSPIRGGEATASFKVDTVKNLWYDHGAGKGGNVIDLVCELRRVTVAEALAILAGVAVSGASIAATTPPAATRLVADAFSITSVREVHHPKLVAYLGVRGIPLDLARAHLKEVHYAPAGDGSACYYGLGFRCGDGWDVRSAVFKGFVGTRKDVTLIDAGQGSSVVVFEGFLDYLSFLAHLGLEKYDGSVLILHSTAQTVRGIARLQGRSFASGVFLYLDQDAAGRRATAAFIAGLEGCGVPVVDKSDLYAGYSDFNAWWMERAEGADGPR